MSHYSHKILIENSGFTNRGDQLMIQAVVEQINRYWPHAQILLKKNAFLQNPSYCMEHKIFPLDLSKSRIKRSWLYKRAVNFLLREEWMVTPEDVDIIFDCRGYHMADWRIDKEYLDYLKYFYGRFTKKERRYIMLPQAFGPFNNKYSQEAMLMLHSIADCIYAREDVSYAYLRELLPESRKIAKAPDFTCLTEPYLNQRILLSPKSYVLIIPNIKMVEQHSGKDSNQYVDFLTMVAKHLQMKGENVYLLNHEGSDDETLLKQVNYNLGNTMPILTDLSGIDIKAIIKDAKLVISGRFHGVVSGLTQGVPTLCTGWSHKYAELLKEHECSDNFLLVEDINESISKIDAALNTPLNFSSKKGCNDIIKEHVNKMWEEIFNKIN